MNKDIKNIKKPTWYVIFVVAISVIVFIVAAVVIYSTFFESKINQEKNKKAAQEYMTDKLASNSEEAKEHRKLNQKIIEEYNLDIFGSYTCTFNESELDENGEPTLYTNEITRVMELKEDSTAEFNDGTKGWWMLHADKYGIVRLGLVVPQEKNPQIYLIGKDFLIDETKACFIGKVPSSNTFDATFTAGNLTLEFSADGSIDGEYTEMMEEDGTKYPRTEAYSGTYKRDGSFLDITLNGADARYYIFEIDEVNFDEPISGFASRYYIKNK